ncbi:ImmA/IrrE family metallo-endopeptidase [Caviibacter abscessus]|uniref:ImmA/IrrE family metallo-endopeptidase n=1 Tax=Caviibacter abscessus TaxID=1766719 RepID=UPI000838B8BB|nr:ImmA/IrrE family metallo-endopeptidase [Caviibacter abscessus]
MQVKDIINLTYQLKKECNNDINQLLDKYNCEIMYLDFDNILGYNHRIKDINYIYINKNIPAHNQEFVLLHEIGHIILHDKDCRYFLKGCMHERTEFQANLFATLFLDCQVKYNYTNDYIQKVINNVLSSLFTYNFYGNQ